MSRRVAVRTLLALLCTAILMPGCSPARYVYYPSPTISRTPADAGMPYEDVTLLTSDGVKINAWYIPRSDARGTVIFCHGNAGNISHRVETAEVLHGLGLNVLLFDYRGFGRSEGQPNEEGTYLDALAAWRYVTTAKGESASRVIVHGRSLGGSVAAHLAAEEQPAALIVESAFTSLDEMAVLVTGSSLAPMLCTFNYRTIADIGSIYCPSLFIHSRQDELVPYSMGRRLFEISPAAFKDFIEISGRHSTGWRDSMHAYRGGLAAFLNQALARRSVAQAPVPPAED